MLRALLDAQQRSYLVESPDDCRLGLDVDKLRAAVQTRRVEVVGTIEILQELVATALSNRQKCKKMVGLFFEL